MKSREFEKLAFELVRCVETEMVPMALPFGFIQYGAYDDLTLEEALNYNYPTMKRLNEFVTHNSSLSISDSFFEDFEFSLNAKTLKKLSNLNQRRSNNASQKAKSFELLYLSLLEQQTHFRVIHAEDLKLKIDEIINATLHALSNSRNMLLQKKDALSAEIIELHKESEPGAKKSVFFDPDNISIKSRKMRAVAEIISCLQLAENFTQEIKDSLSKIPASKYPSLSELRDHLKTPYENICKEINKILNNENIKTHTSIGKIINLVLRILTFSLVGYSTNTNTVINKSLGLVEKSTSRFMIG